MGGPPCCRSSVYDCRPHCPLVRIHALHLPGLLVTRGFGWKWATRVILACEQRVRLSSERCPGCPAWSIYSGHLPEQVRRASPSIYVRTCSDADRRQRVWPQGFAFSIWDSQASLAPQPIRAAQGGPTAPHGGPIAGTTVRPNDCLTRPAS